jgi:predicted nucleic acid-binding protein
VNRKSLQNNDKALLLDTSFLLPILGFETINRVMNAFRKLKSYTLYYNDISLLEALWKIVKVIEGRDEEIERIKEGVLALRNTVNYVSIDDEAVKYAIKMYKLKHRDMVDNLLYALSVTNNLKLLTVDNELTKFIEKHGLPKKNIITPEEL